MQRFVKNLLKRSRGELAFLAAMAAFALCPQVARPQAMTRDDPALTTRDAGGPTVSVNGHADQSDDATVRQAQSSTGGVRANVAYGDSGEETSVIDLTGAENGGPVSLIQGLKWRPYFSLTLGVNYNDNIFVSPHKQGDFISTIQPRVIMAYGDYQDVVRRVGSAPHVYDVPAPDDSTGRYVYFDYHPTFLLFAKNSSENSVDESATLLAGYTFTKLALSTQAQYQRLSGDDVDLGGRIDRDLYTGTVTALYNYSDKTSLEMNVYGDDREYAPPYISSTEVGTRDFFNYQYGPKTSVSAGFALGYVDYRTNTTQEYEQALVRVVREQFAKLDFSLTAGVEYRESTDADNMINAVFDLTATYHLSENTTFFLSAARDTEPSGLRDDDINYTRVNLAASQKLFSRVYLTLNIAYANADYNTIANNSVSRSDDTEEIGIDLEADLTRYASLQFTYTFRNNTSTVASRTFTENLGGVQVRLTY